MKGCFCGTDLTIWEMYGSVLAKKKRLQSASRGSNDFESSCKAIPLLGCLFAEPPLVITLELEMSRIVLEVSSCCVVV